MIMNSNTGAKTNFSARKCHLTGIIRLFVYGRTGGGAWKIRERKQYVSF